MSKIEMFRKALALPEVIQNVELTGVLKELYIDHLELLEKNNELKAQLKSLEDIADIKKKAKVKNGFYTLDGVKDIDGNRYQEQRYGLFVRAVAKSGTARQSKRHRFQNGNGYDERISRRVRRAFEKVKGKEKSAYFL